MRLIIDGREYDGSAQPFIGDLRLLKKACGFGYGTVIERMQKLDENNWLKMVDDDLFIEALIAWMWMSRLRAGERELTFEQAGMVALDQFQMVDDTPDAPEVAADPTQASGQTDSSPADAKPHHEGKQRTRRSTTTSSLQSIPA
jgi:hypothetical protein